MSLTERLLTAMHAAGASVARTARHWIELAQSHHVLLEAMRKAFGKRLPTPQKLGLWLSERLGQTADDLILQGQHSARRKQWTYRIASKAKIAEELASRAVRLVPSVEIPMQSPAFVAPALAAHLPPAEPPKPAPAEPPKPAAPKPEYESKSAVDRSTGEIKRELLTDRDGMPIEARAAPKAPSRLEGGKLLETKREFRDGQYWNVEHWLCHDGQLRENWCSPPEIDSRKG